MSADAAAKAAPLAREAPVEGRLNFSEDGKRFRCEFIREGPVFYGEKGGIECLRRGTIEASLATFIGKPLVIEHISPALDPADTTKFTKHGEIDRTGFDPASGFFFCEGEVQTAEGKKAALELNASCGYRVNSTGPACRWNNVPCVRELTQIEFHHLALTRSRPRYEEADFRLNAVDNPTGETIMFKFIRKFLPTGAPAGTAPTIEEIDIPADTKLKTKAGVEFRLNDAIESYEKANPDETADQKAARLAKEKEEADAAASRLNAVTDETEVVIKGKAVKVSVLREHFEAAETARLAAAAQGNADFHRLNAAARDATAVIPTDFPRSAGTLEDGLKRGKY